MFTLVFVFDRLAPRECRNARSPPSPMVRLKTKNKVCHREAVKVCHCEAVMKAKLAGLT